MKFDLKRFFGAANKTDEASPPGLAVAHLLLEIARADDTVSEAEWNIIRTHLAQAFGLSKLQLDALVTKVSAHAEQSVSLHDTVKIINKSLSADDKTLLVRALWQVAYADQRLDAHEEALLRRLADLLYVPHSVFIREKLKTQLSS